MDSDPIIVLVFLLMLYLFFRDLHPLPAPVAQHDVPSGEDALQPEERVAHVFRSDPLSRRTSQVDQDDAKSPVRDGDWTAFERSHATMQVVEENSSSNRSAGSSTSVMGNHGEQPTSANPVSLTASVSTLGPSLKNFAGLKVNTTYSFLASRRSATPDGTPPSSPLSSPPSSPSSPSSPSFASSLSSFQTPVASRRGPGPSSNSVDFSRFKKKTRTLSKSPKKSQTKAAGKSPSSEATITAWFYKTSTGSQLMDIPPDLTGHPDGLALGNIYFDWVEDRYQLWLWCLDSLGAPHWKKIPSGYEREDGKRLIVTRHKHFLSWVTTKYYKELVNDGSKHEHGFTFSPQLTASYTEASSGRMDED